MKTICEHANCKVAGLWRTSRRSEYAERVLVRPFEVVTISETSQCKQFNSIQRKAMFEPLSVYSTSVLLHFEKCVSFFNKLLLSDIWDASLDAATSPTIDICLCYVHCNALSDQKRFGKMLIGVNVYTAVFPICEMPSQWFKCAECLYMHVRDIETIIALWDMWISLFDMKLASFEMIQILIIHATDISMPARTRFGWKIFRLWL